MPQFRSVLIPALALAFTNAACTKKESSGEVTHPSGTAVVADAAPEPTAPNPISPVPAPPKPLVSAKTLAELHLIRDFQRENFLNAGPEPVMGPNETSLDFEERHREWARSAKNSLRTFQKDLQTFCVTPAMAYANCRHSKLTKYLKDPATGFSGEGWECRVYDVKRAGIGVEILCSTEAEDAWTYSVIGGPPKGTKIAKGDLVRFKKLDVGIPRRDEAVKMTFVYGNNFQWNKESLGVEVVATAAP